jgi:DNA-binding transcriptional LysR family regulator
MSVSPPRPRMPSLNSLRAFEAVARMTSIAAAAEELCVTPAAVAQQVKLLEAWTGGKLLKRNPQGVELTALGSSVLTDFTRAFDQLGEAVQKLRTKAAPTEIRIAALPSVAQLWVSPRLPDIRSRMPNLSISVSALEQKPNLVREPFDLAIFYSEDVSKNELVINQDVIFPVASPLIAQRVHSLIDLANEVFLHDVNWKDDWKTWLSVAAPAENLYKSGPEFTLYALAVEECKNGAGVLMGHEDLVRPQIEAGELVPLFDKGAKLQRSLTISTMRTPVQGSVLSNFLDRLIGNIR